MKSENASYWDEQAAFIHDINTLLSLISHSSEIGVLCEDLNPEQLAQLFNQCHAAARSAIDLVESYALFESPQYFDLRELVLVVGRAIDNDPHHPIEVVLPDFPMFVSFEPCALKRIVLNLGANAQHAGQVHIKLEQGTHLSRPKAILVGTIPPQAFAILTVSDQGNGIPEEILERIWENGSTTKNDPGTGLGLPLVRRLVEKLGVGLDLQTTEGEGTDVRVYLPLTLGCASAGRIHPKTLNDATPVLRKPLCE